MSDTAFYLNLMRAYIDSANDGIFVLCDEMKFHVANRILESWLGASEDALTEHKCRRPITDFIDDGDNFAKHFNVVLAGHPVRFECMIRPRDGSSRHLEISLSKVDLEIGDLIIGVARDITERKRLLEEMEYRATHDHVTGLINRPEFERRLDAMIDEARRDGGLHALLRLDMDQFKVVNDTCGHLAGDALLAAIAHLLDEAVRPLGGVLARIGGDEFGLLLPDCVGDQAVAVAETCRRVVAEYRFQWHDSMYRVGVSIGIAPISTVSTSTVEVMGAADAACYVSKGKGGNHIHMDAIDSESRAMHGQMYWISEINRALVDGRLVLYRQEIRRISQNSAINRHCEILVRLVDDAGNIINPVQFIPAAERFGIMGAVDRCVIETLFSMYMKDFQNGGARDADAICPLYSVNISGASLNDSSFSGFLREQMKKYGIPPSILCFEITETVAVGNVQRVSDFIAELKAMGCYFSLDDFGSGMSSFGYLSQFDVDFLKIDGALVRGIVGNPVNRVMVEAINKIGHAMDIATIAEYVENDAILDGLKEIGVDFVQGFGLHRPEPLLLGQVS